MISLPNTYFLSYIYSLSIAYVHSGALLYNTYILSYNNTIYFG